MNIEKSTGVTDSERWLTSLCERTFLGLWSYPNPCKDDGDELCDLLAVFENHVFIFFDRENNAFNNVGVDHEVAWKRWKKKAIDSQIRTVLGAEKYIKAKREIFLDSAQEVSFPLPIDHADLVIHKIIVAHGIKAACEQFSPDNVHGSLGITYGSTKSPINFPFMLDLDKNNQVHVLDTVNLPIVLQELDTFYDFSTYLTEKENAISSLNGLCYCGEEDLLAHYLSNYDSKRNKHYIGSVKADYDFLAIGEGEWADFIQRDQYKAKKKADRVSYFWDEFIQRTSNNALAGRLTGNSNPFDGVGSIQEMAKEPRFHRRALSDRMLQTIDNFPDSEAPIMRQVTLLPSFHKGLSYVFLQLKFPVTGDYETEYRPIRARLLEIACGAAKNMCPELTKVVGIALDNPKFSSNSSNEMAYLDCSEWSPETAEHYRHANDGPDFFTTDKLTKFEDHNSEFPTTHKKTANEIFGRKVGRNELCPCGSKLKFKKCCLQRNK